MPDKKLPIPEFAAKIKAKYPEYQSVNDTVLVQRIIEKYPAYAEQVDMSGLKKKDGGTPVSGSQGNGTTSPTGGTPFKTFDDAIKEGKQTLAGIIPASKPKESKYNPHTLLDTELKAEHHIRLGNPKFEKKKLFDDLPVKDLFGRATTKEKLYEQQADFKINEIKSNPEKLLEYNKGKLGEVNSKIAELQSQKKLHEDAQRDFTTQYQDAENDSNKIAELNAQIEELDEYKKSRKTSVALQAAKVIVPKYLDNINESDPRTVGREILRIADPDESANLEMLEKSGRGFGGIKNAQLERDGIDLIKYELEQSDHPNKEAGLQRMAEYEADFDERNFELTSNRIRENIGNVIAKEGGTLSIKFGYSEAAIRAAFEKTNPTESQRKVFENHTLPIEKKIWGTNIPTTGFERNFYNAVERSAIGTGNTVAGWLGNRNDEDRLLETYNDEGQRYRNAKDRTTWQEIRDGIGDVTGQVAEMALLGKGIGGAGKALKLSKMANDGVGLFLNSYLISYDNYRTNALQILPGKENEGARKGYAMTMAAVEGLSEQIFKDTKILKAFSKGIAPSVADITKRIVSREITQAAAKKELASSIKTYLKGAGKEFAKAELQQGVEEASVDIADGIAESVFGKKPFDATKTGEKAIKTFVTTMLHSPLVAGMSAHGAYKQSNAQTSFFKAHILDIAKDPVPYLEAVDELAIKGEITPEEAEEKTAIINKAKEAYFNMPMALGEKKATSFILHKLNGDERSETIAEAVATGEIEVDEDLNETTKDETIAEELGIKKINEDGKTEHERSEESIAESNEGTVGSSSDGVQDGNSGSGEVVGREKGVSGKKLYHGSDVELGKFDTKPIFFSENPEYPKGYGSNVKEYSVDIKKPFDTADEVARKIYNEEFIPFAKEKSKGDKRYEPLKEGERVPFTTADLLYLFLRKSKREGKDFGYDGVTVDERIDGEISHFPLSQEQIKPFQQKVSNSRSGDSVGKQEQWQLTQGESFEKYHDKEEGDGLRTHEEMASDSLKRYEKGDAGISIEGNSVVYRNEKGEPVGFALFNKNGITEIGVDKKERGKSISTKMVDYLKEQKGIDKILPPFSKEGNIISHRNEVKKALAEGKYEQAIADGEMTKEQVDEIVKSAGLKPNIGSGKTVGEQSVIESEKEPAPIEGRTPVTLSGLTELERQEAIEKRKSETVLGDKGAAVNGLLTKIKEYNALPNGNKGKQRSEGLNLLNNIRLEADGMGYKFDAKSGKLINEKGRAVKETHFDGAIEEGAKTLQQRDSRTQEVFQTLLDENVLPVFYDAKGQRMSESRVNGAIEDIQNGIPSVRATRVLEQLETYAKNDAYEIFDKGTGGAAPTLAQLLQVNKETVSEPMTEEALGKWLNEESKLTPEQEQVLIDNIENILEDYEPRNEKSTSAEVQQTESAGQSESISENKPTAESAEPTIEAINPAETPISKPAKPPKASVHAERPATVLSMRGLQNVANEFSLDDVERRSKKTDVELRYDAEMKMSEWQEEGTYAENIEELVADAEKAKVLTDIERVIMEQHLANEIGKGRELRGTPEYDAQLKVIRRLKEAGQKTRSAAGAALRIPTNAGSFPRTVEDAMVERMEAAQVEELTDEQKKDVEKKFAALEKALEEETKKKEEAQKKYADLQARMAIEEAKKRFAKGKENKEKKDRKKERDDIKADIKKKWKDAGNDGTLTAVPIPYAKQLVAIAPDVAKLMKSYVAEGVTELKEIVSKIHGDLGIDDITKEDIQDIIAGKYSETRTQSELTKTIRDLRDEAKLLDRLAALMNGEVPASEKAKVERSKKITDLQNQISSIKKDKADAERQAKKELADEEKRLKKEREDAKKEEERLAKEFEAEKRAEEKAKIKAAAINAKKISKELDKATPELRVLENAIKRNNAKAAELEEKLKNGDFAKAEKPQSWIDNTEFKKLYPIEYNKALDAIAAKEKAAHELAIANLKAEMAARPQWKKFIGIGGRLARTLKATMAGIDMSAIGVQNLLAILANPTVGAKGIATSVKDAVSPKHFERELTRLHNSEWWPLIEKAKLRVVDPKALKESEKSDIFNDTLYDKITYKGKNYAPTKPFERAFTSLGNYIRVNLFLRKAAELLEQGKTFESHPQDFKAIADVVNNLTGQGTMDEKIELHSKVLSTVFWSPRLMASTLNVLGIGDLAMMAQGKKGFYGNLLSSDQKAYAAGQLARGIGMGVALMMAYAYGRKLMEDDDEEIKIDTDPTSVTFGQVKDGDYSWGIFGRYTGVVRLLAMKVTGVKTTEKGEQDLDSNRFGASMGDETFKWFRGKFNPVFGAGYSSFTGSDYSGKKTTAGEELKKMLYPMSVNEIIKGIEEDGAAGVLKRGLPSFMGIKVGHKNDFMRQNTFGVKAKIKGEEKVIPDDEYFKFATRKKELEKDGIKKLKERGAYFEENGAAVFKKFNEMTYAQRQSKINSISKQASETAKKELFGEQETKAESKAQSIVNKKNKTLYK